MFDTIVWATDGSPDADQALVFAKALAHEQGASLVVVHVVQRYASPTRLAVYADEQLVRTKLEEAVAELERDGLPATLRVVDHIGPQPAQEIADLAREVEADLIVVGSRGYGPVAGLVRGSVVPRLMHVAPCPVVAVPPGASSPVSERWEFEEPALG
jgi:nucleotide-binding universal stress UspA family protein